MQRSIKKRKPQQEVREPHGDLECASPSCQGYVHRVDGICLRRCLSEKFDDDVFYIVESS